jgi:NDP-sugar pyrophosphorylase family protein
MKIIIPMAGSGERFIEAGYKDPKPLIKIRGKRMIEYIVDMFDRENDEFIFICSVPHIWETDMSSVLEDIVRNHKILSIAPHKFGPVYSIIKSSSYIKNDEPVIVVYCDTPLNWNYDKFKNYVKGIDGCLVSNVGFHPHSLSSTIWAHSKVDEVNRVLEVKEKAYYSNDPLSEHASAGLYYFSRGEYITKYFNQLLDEKITYNGEYYVTLVYNLLIKDGLKVYSYLADKVLAFGMPDEVRNYEAWQTILEGSQVKNEDDVVNCYNYWKNVTNKS